jgi:hypothetical protein
MAKDLILAVTLLFKVLQPESDLKQVSVNGMTIKWEVQSNDLVFEVFAPTDGWVAIGFNPKNNIVGTNLIMGASKPEETIVEDQYVIAAGVHKMTQALGGVTAIRNFSCIENNSGTILKFSIPTRQTDKFHYRLMEGTKIWLICAFSQENDFNHHSIMREHIEIVI